MCAQRSNGRSGLHRVLEPGRRAAAGRRSGWTPTPRSAPTRCGSPSSGSTSTPRPSASCRVLRDGDGAAVRAAVLDIVADPRQDAEPGHRLRRHAHRHRRRRRPGVAARAGRRRPGRHPGLAHPHPAAASPTGWPAGTAGPSRSRPQGTAILFARSIAAVLPDDLPDAVSLAVLDVCGAPAADRPGRASATGRPRRSTVLGGAGKSGSLSPGRGPRRRAPPPSPASCATDGRGGRADAPPGWPTASSSPTPATRSRSRAARGGSPADVTVVCVDVPGREHGAILATAEGGTVVFFSMATSFPAAALGAEGMAADVTMLIGNGYMPGPRRPRPRPATAPTPGVPAR